MVVISLQWDYNGLDLSPSCLTSALTFRDLTWANSNFVTNLEATFKNGTSSNTSLECFCVLTRLVDIKGANNDHVRWNSELACWDGDSANIVDDNIDVVLEYSWNRNNGNGWARSCREWLLDFVLLFRYSDFILDDQINLVLKDNNMLETHDINSNQMLSSLRLWVWLISSDEQECSVHDGRTCKHSSHEGIVTWAIDKRDVSS